MKENVSLFVQRTTRELLIDLKQGNDTYDDVVLRLIERSKIISNIEDDKINVMNIEESNEYWVNTTTPGIFYESSQKAVNSIDTFDKLKLFTDKRNKICKVKVEIELTLGDIITLIPYNLLSNVSTCSKEKTDKLLSSEELFDIIKPHIGKIPANQLGKINISSMPELFRTLGHDVSRDRSRNVANIIRTENLWTLKMVDNKTEKSTEVMNQENSDLINIGKGPEVIPRLVTLVTPYMSKIESNRNERINRQHLRALLDHLGYFVSYEINADLAYYLMNNELWVHDPDRVSMEIKEIKYYSKNGGSHGGCNRFTTIKTGKRF